MCSHQRRRYTNLDGWMAAPRIPTQKHSHMHEHYSNLISKWCFFVTKYIIPPPWDPSVRPFRILMKMVCCLEEERVSICLEGNSIATRINGTHA